MARCPDFRFQISDGLDWFYGRGVVIYIRLQRSGEHRADRGLNEDIGTLVFDIEHLRLLVKEGDEVPLGLRDTEGEHLNALHEELGALLFQLI